MLEGVYRGKSEDGIGPLSAGDGKVPDGVRYHVLDVWVDGLVETDGWEAVGIMRPVERLRTEGRTKVVRERATAVLEDERLQGIEERRQMTEMIPEAMRRENSKALRSET